ncbi:MAG: glyoxalase [Planctomycetes bacterium]|nr:glyoxalase [Planctomycetota bacterium]
MPIRPKTTTATVIPCMCYRDPNAAIQWLCKVFGFKKHYVVPDETGGVVHAELSFGNGMMMLGPLTKGDWSKLIRQPSDLGGAETQCPCVVVENADVVYRNVKKAGGEIVIDIADQHYGGRSFTCRDLEGHIWNIGTYDPFHPPRPAKRAKKKAAK